MQYSGMWNLPAPAENPVANLQTGCGTARNPWKKQAHGRRRQPRLVAGRRERGRLTVASGTDCSRSRFPGCYRAAQPLREQSRLGLGA